MIRLLILKLILFSLPFIIYGAWVLLSRRRLKREGAAAPEAEPVFARGAKLWLSCAGLLLVIGGFIYTALTTGAEPGGTYTPAEVGEDGELIPGRID